MSRPDVVRGAVLCSGLLKGVNLGASSVVCVFEVPRPATSTMRKRLAVALEDKSSSSRIAKPFSVIIVFAWGSYLILTARAPNSPLHNG